MILAELPPVILADSEADLTHTASVDVVRYGAAPEILLHDAVYGDDVADTSHTVLQYGIDDAERVMLDLGRAISVARQITLEEAVAGVLRLVRDAPPRGQGELFGRAA